MIPGGDVGLFNGYVNILGNNLGKQYGGLLVDCEDEVGYNADNQTIYEKRKSCLTNKCNPEFSDKGQVLQYAYSLLI